MAPDGLGFPAPSGKTYHDYADARAAGPNLAFFDCGGTRLFLNAQEKPGPESILYLRVADIRTAYDLLRSRGIEFVDAPHLIHRHGDGTEEWMAHFRDPEGRPLAIMSQAKP